MINFPVFLSIYKNPHQTLHGLVSWGQSCGKAGLPGVYADVFSAMKWISEVTGLKVNQPVITPPPVKIKPCPIIEWRGRRNTQIIHKGLANGFRLGISIKILKLHFESRNFSRFPKI